MCLDNNQRFIIISGQTDHQCPGEMAGMMMKMMNPMGSMPVSRQLRCLIIITLLPTEAGLLQPDLLQKSLQFGDLKSNTEINWCLLCFQIAIVEYGILKLCEETRFCQFYNFCEFLLIFL